MFKYLIGCIAVACMFFGGAVLIYNNDSVFSTTGGTLAFYGGLATCLFLLIQAGRKPVKPSILNTKYTGKSSGNDSSNDNPILHRGGTLETVTRSLSANRQAPPDASKSATSFVVGDKSSSHLQVATEPQPDGTVKITVVATGYSGSQFKQRIRPRLASVRGVKWQHPTNLGENKRQLEGVISGDANSVTAAISSLNA